MTVTPLFGRSKDGFIETRRGLTLRVRDCGKGEPLLLINGLGGCIEGWQTLADQLPGRRFIAVDHPGTGCSQVPDRLLTIAELSELYLEVMDQFGIETFDVLGFSFGGTVTQQLAKDHPDRVRSIVLAGTACGWGGFPADMMTLMVAANPLRYQFKLAREMAAPMLYRGRVGREPLLFQTDLKGWSAHRASMMGVFYQIAAYSTWSSLAWLKRLKTPTLVLGGEEDPMAPAANSKLLAATIPNAELHIIEEGGHLFPFDRAEDVGPIVTEFLQRHRQAAAA